MTFTRPTRVQEPTKEAPGIFENLQMIVGAGWDPTSDCAKMLDQSWENGVFFYFQRERKFADKIKHGKIYVRSRKISRHVCLPI